MMIAEPGRYAANAPLRPLQAPQSRRHEEDDHDHDDGFTDEPDYPDYYDHEGYTEEDEVEVEDDDEFYDLEKDNLRSKRHCWRICRIVVILYVCSFSYSFFFFLCFPFILHFLTIPDRRVPTEKAQLH